MRVRVRLFAALHDLAGVREVELEVAPGTTAGGALSLLREQHPALAAYPSRLLMAVNAAYAQPDSPLAEGDELALIPPVSGGARCSW